MVPLQQRNEVKHNREDSMQDDYPKMAGPIVVIAILAISLVAAWFISPTTPKVMAATPESAPGITNISQVITTNETK